MSHIPHKLFEVWQEPGTLHPWKAQLNGYVVEQDTRAAVESYVAAEKELLFRDSGSMKQE
jgi:hypothetical protein